MKVLITGAGGGLGQALTSSAPGEVQLTPFDKTGLDITDESAVRAVFDAHAPQIVINCAAWTDVDGAEKNADSAHAVNERGAANLATACAQGGARLIHISTDFVFDGTKHAPYTEDDMPAPLGVYGKSKLAGEQRVTESDCNHLIVRTSWLYALSNEKTFPHRVLEWGRKNKRVELALDNIGSPTHADALARALWQLAPGEASGILHWAGAGAASRLEFGKLILDEAISMGAKLEVEEVIPVPAEKFALPAPRPGDSSLDCARAASLGVAPAPWQDMAREFLQAWVAMSRLRQISSRK